MKGEGRGKRRWDVRGKEKVERGRKGRTEGCQGEGKGRERIKEDGNEGEGRVKVWREGRKTGLKS